MIQNCADLCAGAVIFVGGNTVLSKLVRSVLSFKYSHVMFYVGGGNIIEADFGGVAISKFQNYVGNDMWYGEVLVPNLPEEARMHAVVEAMAKDKQGYDYTLFAGNAISRLLHRSRRRAGLWNQEEAWICSELIAYSLSKAGMQFGLPISQITPKELYIKLKEGRANGTK